MLQQSIECYNRVESVKAICRVLQHRGECSSGVKSVTTWWRVLQVLYSVTTQWRVLQRFVECYNSVKRVIAVCRVLQHYEEGYSGL